MGIQKEPNLLLGMMAFQLGIVPKEQFVSAVAHWQSNKSRSMEEVLAESGAFNSVDRQLLRDLATQHLSAHNGDPVASIGALMGIAAVVDELRTLGDPDVDSALSSVDTTIGLGIVESLGADTLDFDSQTAAKDSQLNAENSRFHTVKLHAKGGLGEVYRARDHQLNREVALKEIQPKYADDQGSRSRFLLEAEVTGGLEHPGIVPVYALGRHEDGRPYYVMRFIRGQTLHHAVDQFYEGESASDYSGLAFRKLLGRFMDVCQAMEYAHSRGVLHRDLKPGNIMLGKYGETLVVDWGLARTQDSEDSVEAPLRPTMESAGTMAGRALGTPAFMPPEQAAGDLESLGPASDVYALGATLYYMLTGRTPFSGDDVSALLEQVKAGDFPSPRQVRPSAPMALEKICLKAMALNGAERYASPQVLSEDIERYLADEPTSAHKESWVTRSRRWVRKHQVLTVSTAAVLMVSVIGLSVFASVLGGKNAELVTLNAKEQTARELAEANEFAAKSQSQLALSTMVAVIHDIQAGLKTLPGGGEVRRRLLNTSLEKIQQIATFYVDQTLVDQQSLHALLEMGEVVLNYGADLSSDLNTVESAESLSTVKTARLFFERALEIAESDSYTPLEVAHESDLINSLLNLGHVQLLLGDMSTALTLTERAVGQLQAENLAASIDVYRLLGNIKLRMGEVEEAREAFQSSLDASIVIAGADPQDDRLQIALGYAYERLGEVSFQGGRTEEALDALKQSVRIADQLVTNDSDNLDYQGLRVRASVKLGDVYAMATEDEDALAAYEQTLESARKLSAEDPSNHGFRHGLSIAIEKVGKTQANLGKGDDRWVEESLKLRQQLVEYDPANVRWQLSLSAAYDHRGDLQLKSKQTEAALKSYETGMEIREALQNRGNNDAEAVRAIAISYSKIAGLQHASGKSREALESYNKGLKIFQRIANDDSSNALAVGAIYAIQFKVAGIYESLKEWEAAAPAYRAAAATLENMIENEQAFLRRAQMLQVRKGLAGDVKNAELHAIAVGEWEKIFEHPEDLQIDLLEVRATTFASRKDLSKAARAASKLIEYDDQGIKPMQFFNAATVLGHCAGRVGAGEDGPLSESQLEYQRNLIRRSLDAVRRGGAGGWNRQQVEMMENANSFNILRDLPEFQEMLQQAKTQ